MTGPAAWHTACVYYFDDRGRDDLIVDAVRPLFAAVGVPAHFKRHWRRGPHVRLNFRAGQEELARRVLPQLEATVGAFLRERPSVSPASAMAAATLLPLHVRLLELEREHGQLWPWRADNSVHVEPYDSRAHVFGGAPAAELVADFYTASNGTAFESIDLVRCGRQQRLWLAFDLMVATAHALAAGGIRGGYVSFRAHAEVFLARTDVPDRWRTDWDCRYRRAAAALGERLRSTVTAVEGAGDAGGAGGAGGHWAITRAWLDVLCGLRERAFALLDTGQLRMDAAPAGREPPQGASPFLRELITNEAFHRRLMPSPAFRRYRLLLNLLYLHLTRLGVRPVDRYLLCHLVACSVEERHGLDSVE